MASSKFRKHIPEELVVHILARLPVKSLLRFKCVSKLWLSIVSSSRFVKTHLNSYLPPSPKVMINSRPTMHCSAHSLIFEHVPELVVNDFPAEWFFVVGSCNGLLLLFVGDLQEFDLCIWNPSTRKSFELPPYTDRVDITWGSFGLAYSDSRDDYMVLGIFTASGGIESEVKLYSCKANSWKRIGAFKNDIPVYDTSCKFVSGKFYFCTCPDGSYEYSLEEPPVLFDIYSFDLENEVYGMIEQPDYGDGVLELSLDVIEECISVVCRKKSEVDVMVRREYGGEAYWSKRVTNCFASYSGRYLNLKPLVMLASGEMLLVYKKRLAVYDPNEDGLWILNLGKIEDADVYVESLVWPTQPKIAEGKEE